MNLSHKITQVFAAQWPVELRRREASVMWHQIRSPGLMVWTFEDSSSSRVRPDFTACVTPLAIHGTVAVMAIVLVNRSIGLHAHDETIYVDSILERRSTGAIVRLFVSLLRKQFSSDSGYEELPISSYRAPFLLMFCTHSLLHSYRDEGVTIRLK